MIRDISFHSQKGFLKGLMLVVSILLAIAFVTSYEYNMNYNVIPETNSLTLQQGSNYSIFVDYKFNTSKELNFYFEIVAPEGIDVYYSTSQKSAYDFQIPLRVFVSNDVPLGNYNIKILSILDYEGLKTVKETVINLKVVEKSKVLFSTDNYYNDLPNLNVVNTSQKNFLINGKDEKQIIFTLENVGSTANYFIDTFIESSDKEKIHLKYDKYILLQKDSQKNFIVNISFDENYNVDFTRIHFIAKEQATNKEYLLGIANFTLSVEDIMVIFNKEEKTLDLVNTGNNISEVNIKTAVKTYDLFLRPNQNYILNFEDSDKNVQVYLNKELFGEFVISESEQEKEENDFSLFPTGFFSLSDNSTIGILFGLFILLLVLAIYKMFLSRNSIFGKNYYAKDLGLK
jgi:hypothetical protein